MCEFEQPSQLQQSSLPLAGGGQPPAEGRIAEIADMLVPDTSAFQRDLIADGVVSRAEYEQAVFAAVQCLQQRALDVTDPIPSPNGITPEFNIISEGEITPAVDAHIEKSYNECAAEYLEDVEIVYVEQNILTGAERQAMLGAFAGCLTDAGVEGVTSGMGSDQLVDLLRNDPVARVDPAPFECYAQYEFAVLEPFEP